MSEDTCNGEVSIETTFEEEVTELLGIALVFQPVSYKLVCDILTPRVYYYYYESATFEFRSVGFHPDLDMYPLFIIFHG